LQEKRNKDEWKEKEIRVKKDYRGHDVGEKVTYTSLLL
jgi:hypothetical protein